jgi:hypothetical protein
MLQALGASLPAAGGVLATQLGGPEPVAQIVAMTVIVLGLPWIVPAFVVVAVASAPVYVALHIAGAPQPLMPWLAGVILVAGVLACHVNAALLLARLQRARHAPPDPGLAPFLRRAAAVGR